MISLPFELALKYLKSNKGGLFSFTSILAIVGLCVGVSSLIIVTSVMNGFEKELQNRILGVVPQIGRVKKLALCINLHALCFVVCARSRL